MDIGYLPSHSHHPRKETNPAERIALSLREQTALVRQVKEQVERAMIMADHLKKRIAEEQGRDRIQRRADYEA